MVSDQSFAYAKGFIRIWHIDGIADLVSRAQIQTILHFPNTDMADFVRAAFFWDLFVRVLLRSVSQCRVGCEADTADAS